MNKSLKYLITGGAGFIGSALVRHIIQNSQHRLLNLDKLTYAGNLNSVQPVAHSDRYQFVHGDITDAALVQDIFNSYQPDRVIHLAAESHVDRSISGPADFIQTNIVGTYVLLEASRQYLNAKDKTQQDFKFLHVSTDEVFGDLTDDGQYFTEHTSYAPSSPYSASKASSDHLVRAWGRTYGLPVMVTNCSNNYGPYHYPEKLIPLMIINALQGKPLPVYGNGQQIRDWLYVDDHARALLLVSQQGIVGETYLIGGRNEHTNLSVVQLVCSLLDELVPSALPGVTSYHQLISFVADRPGHDERYAIDASKIQAELGWFPSESFETGLRKTVLWYLENQDWWRPLVRS